MTVLMFLSCLSQTASKYNACDGLADVVSLNASAAFWAAALEDGEDELTGKFFIEIHIGTRVATFRIRGE